MVYIAKDTAVPAAPLASALNRSEQVRDRVEECAQELSSVNEIFQKELAEHLPLEQVEQALLQSEQVEVKVQECADDLSQVNQAVAKEVRERRKLERKLAESRLELADAQAELSDTQTELSDTQIQEKQARYLSLHDGVTGLANRGLFNDRLKHALAQARRHAWRLAVMFIDLDKFKAINDTHGHDAGDKVLQIVGTRLKAAVRDADTVGRQGGDEFVYLMLEARDEIDVANAAAKIAEIIAQPCEFDGLSLIVKPSIGIAIYPQDGKSAGVLLKNADSAMYKAKQSSAGYWLFSRRGG
jgi:diguanylate cyclase (GGDEF)-like protein